MISPHHREVWVLNRESFGEKSPRKASHGCFGAVKSCTHMYTSVCRSCRIHIEALVAQCWWSFECVFVRPLLSSGIQPR